MIARVNMKKRENRRCQNLLRAPLDIIITYLGRTVNRILLHILTKKYVRRCQDNAGFPHMLE